MFQEALEKLILLCLEPYLEGIRLGSLHKGIWNGLIELKELKVKPEVLALLGVPGFRVEKGQIQLIRLVIPWSSLATGKVSLVVSGVHIELEQLAESKSKEELIQAMREAKQQAIDLRVEQVRNLLEQRRKAAEKVAGTDEGFGMKVARRFINNVTVQIEDVTVSFVSKALGIATSLQLPNLAVLSTDENFQEPEKGEVVQIADDSMYKVMRIDGFAVQLSSGGLDSLKDADYILKPISTALKLAHVPSAQRVFVELDLGVGKLSEVKLFGSQVKQLMKAGAALAEEDARLKALMVPEEIGNAALVMEDALKTEYGLLYKRHLLHERRLAVDEMSLSPGERRRKQLLEDALPVEILAANRMAAVELADARQEKMPGFFSQFWGQFCCAANNSSTGSVGMEDLQDATEFEAVEAPANILAEVRFSDLSVKLHDDAEEASSLLRRVLELYVYSTELTAKVATGVDYRGKSSANVQVVGSFGGVEASHCGEDVIRIRTADEQRGQAAKFALENKLEETCNVLSVMLHTAPMDLNFLPSMVPKLLELLQPPEGAEGDAITIQLTDKEKTPAATPKLPAGDASPLSPKSQGSPMSRAVSIGQEAAVHALLGKEGDVAQYADAAFDRVPDQVNFDIVIAAPRVNIPVKDLGSVTMNLGSIKLFTPERCSMKAVRMEVALEDTMLMVATKREEFNVISPLPIDIKLNHNETDDALMADVSVCIGDLTLIAAPQAVKVLAKLPDVFAELAPEAETQVPCADAKVTQVTETNDDRKKLVSEVAGKSEAVQAATQRAKELTEKRLKVNVKANLGKLEVAVLDLIQPVLTLQSRILDDGIQVTHDSLMTGLDMNTSVNLSKLALVAYARNPSSHEWEPLLEPFHIGASLQLESVKEGSDALSTKLSCNAHNPLLLNVRAPSLYRLASLGPIFQASLEPGEFTEKTRYRAVNLSGRPLRLDFICPNRTLHKRLLPDGAEVSLEEEILVYGASDISVSLEGNAKASEPLSIETCGCTVVPGSLCVAQIWMPEPGCRLLLLAPPLRLHNTCDVPLELKLSSSQDDGAKFSCDAQLVGEAPPMVKMKSNFTTLDATAKEKGTYLVMPNEIFAVPEAAIETSNGPRADVSMRPFVEGHEFCTPFSLSTKMETKVESHNFEALCFRTIEQESELPRILGSRGNRGLLREEKEKGESEDITTGAKKDVTVQKSGICACGGKGMVSDPEDPFEDDETSVSSLNCSLKHGLKVGHDLRITRLTVQPILSLVNAVPEMDMTVQYRAASKALTTLLDRRPWKEVQLQSMVGVNVYDLPFAAGAELRGRLGNDAETPWSSPALLRAQALQQSAEMLELDFKQTATGAACGIVAQPLGAGRVRMSCPRLFTHRLDDLKPEEEVQLFSGGAPLPKISEFTMLPNNCESRKCELLVRRWVDGSLREMKHNLTMPAAFDTFDCKTPWGTGYYCMQTEDLAASGMLGASCKVSSLRPRLVVTNASDVDLELQKPDGSVVVLNAQQSKPYHWHISSSNKGAASFHLRPAGYTDVSWSAAIPCSEQAAGSTPLLLSATGESAAPLVWTAEIAPSFGAFSITLKKGSVFMASNKAQTANVNIELYSVSSQKATITGAAVTLVKPGEEAPIGWADPYTLRQFGVKVVIAGEEYFIQDLGRRTEMQIKGLKVVLSVSRVGESTILALDDVYSPVAALLETGRNDDQSVTSDQASTVEVDVQLCQLGVSLVDDEPTPRELLFIHVGDIQLGYKQNMTEDKEEISFRVGQLQGICQLPERVDGSMLEKGRQHKAGVLRKELPAVILANHGEKEANFLDISILREATSSQDLVLPAANVLMDKLDVTVDHDWLTPLLDWLERAIPQDAIDLGITWDDMKAKAGRSICLNYEAPSVPAVACVESLKLSEINLTVWCRLPLSTLDFLPGPVRTILRVVSVSSHFTLNAAQIKLPEKQLPEYRGPVENLGVSIGMDYAASLLKIVMSLLGKSSLLNAGAIPLAMGGTAVSMVTDGVGSAVRGGAGLLEHLAMDEDYNQQQKMKREQKEITGAIDGFKEAGKSLATGLDGALDIFRKPVQGARQDGAKGLAVGCGTGIAGTVVKPVVGVANAGSDIITGISAAATFDSAAKRRRRERCRCRGPRMLYGKSAVMRKWSDSDSQLLLQLGHFAEGVQEIVPLASSAFHRYALLLCVDRLLVVKLRATQKASMSRHSTQVDLQGRGSTRSLSGTGHHHRLDRVFPKLFYSIEDVQRTSSSLSLSHTESHAENVRGLLYEEIKSVNFEDPEDELVLEDEQGNSHNIPMVLESDAKAALKVLLQQAAKGRPNWRNFMRGWRPEEEVHETAIRPKQKEEDMSTVSV